MYAREIFHYIEDLKRAGVPDEQAKIHAEKLAECMSSNLVTKDDLNHAKDQLDSKIQLVKEDLKHVENCLESKIQLVKEELAHVEDRLELKIQHVSDDLTHVKNQLELKMSTVEQRLESKIENVNVKLDWLLRLGGVLGLFMGFIGYLQIHFLHLFQLSSGHL